MKKEKPQIGIRTVKKGENTNSLGMIKFGKARPDKTKYILMNIDYDEKAEEKLFEIGMKLLAKDKEAVIQYVAIKAIKNIAKPKCKK